MAAALRSGRPAADYAQLEATRNPSSQNQSAVPRNAACPCGSGRKYKRCCGRSLSGREARGAGSPPARRSRPGRRSSG
jgi:hypothetical protein